MINTQKKDLVFVCFDDEYNKSIECHLALALSNKVNIIFISNEQALQIFNETPKNIDFLFVDSRLFQEVVNRQNCKEVFILTEQEDVSANLEVENCKYIYKYSSVRSMIDALGNSLLTSKLGSVNDSTKTVTVFSPEGGNGKTTIAIGLAMQLGLRGYKTLFISTDMLQDYQYMLDEYMLMPDEIGYQYSIQPESVVDYLLTNSKKKEFTYFPAWKRMLTSYGIDIAHIVKVIQTIKDRNIFDYIIVDMSSEIRQEKLNFLNQSDRVVLVAKQDIKSVYRLQKLAECMVESSGETVIVQNFYSENAEDFLSPYRTNMKYAVCEKIMRMDAESILLNLQRNHILEKTATAIM